MFAIKLDETICHSSIIHSKIDELAIQVFHCSWNSELNLVINYLMEMFLKDDVRRFRDVLHRGVGVSFTEHVAVHIQPALDGLFGVRPLDDRTPWK